MKEKKKVAIYKHVIKEGLQFTVDPTTKKLTTKPSKRMIEFLINAGPSTTVAQLITIGVFVKVCDCIMEVKKVKKPVKSTRSAKRKLQGEEESKTESKCRKSDESVPEISAQLEKVDKLVKTESMEIKEKVFIREHDISQGLEILESL